VGRARLGLARAHLRPERRRAPARQADHARRAEAHRLGHRLDSLWYGSPHREIVALRKLNFTEEAKELYNLPYGLDGDVEDPTQLAPSPDRTIRNGILGRNAALAYNIDPDAQRTKLVCDEINQLRETEYLDNVGQLTETVPMRENKMHGARTRRDVLKGLAEGPWAP
jgi:uncharacterized protein